MDPVRQLGELLRAIDYERWAAAHGVAGIEPVKARILRREEILSAEDGFPAAVDLFHLGLELEAAQAREALDPVDPDALVEAGLLLPTECGYRSPVDITAWLELFLAHDPWVDGSIASNHVPGGSPAGETIARATMRNPVGSVLDLGTGCGNQAILAAPFAERVVGVDLNPRAIAYAEINARLNGVDNIEFREGDFFAPVAGERFDRVIANPPYIISPDQEILFRDGSDEEGGVCERIVRHLPELLEEGGVGHVLCNWPTQEGENPWEPIGRWTADLPLDVCVLNFGMETLLSYANRWINLSTDDPEAFSEAIKRWFDYYSEQAIQMIWFGMVVVRHRTSETNWFRGFEVRHNTSGFGGSHLERLFAAQDFLATRPGPLLDEIFVPAKAHLLTHVLTYHHGGYDVGTIELAPVEGLGFRGEVSPLALHVLMLFDGERTLGELVNEAAEQHDVDPELLAGVAQEMARDLFEQGFLARVDRGRRRSPRPRSTRA